MLTIHTDYELNQHNTLAVPSVCDFFCEIETQEDLLEAIAFVQKKSLNFYVLGEGSNTLLQKHISGLVAKISLKGRSVKNRTDGDKAVYVRAEAGENWHEFVCFCVQNNCYGLENLSLIPGSVGAAPIQNIGAYGVEIKDVCSAVSVLDLESLEIVTLTNSDCRFDYRESIFKTTAKQKYIVLAVEFCLSQTFTPILDYPGLVEMLNQQTLKSTSHKSSQKTDLKQNASAREVSASSITPTPTAQEVARAVIQLRESKLPNPKQIPNAGSFFKNPVIKEAHCKKLLIKFSSMPHFVQPIGSLGTEPAEVFYKIPAAWLIDRCGWKGKSHRDVGVHDKQALVLVNPKQQALSDVLCLAGLICDDVLKTFSIELELEPQSLVTKTMLPKTITGNL